MTDGAVCAHKDLHVGNKIWARRVGAEIQSPTGSFSVLSVVSFHSLDRVFRLFTLVCLQLLVTVLCSGVDIQGE